MEDFKIYDIVLNENDPMQGIEFISFVNDPAMEGNFIALSKEEATVEVIQLTASKDKQYVTGVVLVPNKVIPRKGNKGIRFSAESIEQCRNQFHESGSLQKTNIEHGDKIINAINNESWIKLNENDKREVVYGLEEVPVGTWLSTWYIPNKNDWNEYILSGKCKGFSIEGMLSQLEAKLSTEVEKEEISIEELKSLLDSIKNMLN